MISAVLFVSFFIFLIMGIPIGICLGLSSVCAILYSGTSLTIVATNMYSGISKFLLLAIPFFVLSGNIMAKAGISKRLIRFVNTCVGHRRGGIAIVCVIVACFFGAISGSGPATTAAVGSMCVPFLTDLGYEKKWSAGLIAVAGGLGVIIPPSISYIVYSAAANASPSALFIAGIIPGCLIGFFLMGYCWYYCKKNGEDKEKLQENYNKIREKGFLKLFKESFFALMTPVIILGCIYSGICSPTEAAVISVIYGFLVCILVYKSIKIREIPKIFLAGSKTYVNILFVIAAASAFARTMTLLKYPQSISKMVLSVTDNKILILLLMNLIMIVCGMIIDNIPNIMILTPIMLPIANALGINPVHLGIFMTCNLAMGMVTPPMGINLFVASGMTKIPLLNLAKATVPFLIAFLVCLALIVFVPGLSLWLPSILG